MMESCKILKLYILKQRLKDYIFRNYNFLAEVISLTLFQNWGIYHIETHLLCKSMDWFFYDKGLRHERIKVFTSKPLLFFFSITKMGVFILFWKHAFIRMKISSLLNRVLGVLACSRAWRAYVLTCLECLLAHVLTWLACLRACVLTCLACLRAYVLACSRAWRAYVLACSRAWRACVLVCTCFAYVLPMMRALRVYH